MLAFLLSSALLAAAPARAMSADQQKIVEQGMSALYRCDYDGAERSFLEPMQAHPGEPVYSLGYATALWWRMENDFALPGSPEEKRFFDAAEVAIKDANAAKRSWRGREQGAAYLYLGAAQGLKGRREASQKRWFAAYLDGRRSYKNEKKAVDLDPELYDAYLGIGAFDYYVATLGRFLRTFAFNKGDKARGLSELHLAAQKGEFSRVAAKLLLVGIDWTFEKDPKDAWTVLEDVSKEFPDSPLIRSMRLIGLYHLRDAAKLKKEAREFLARCEANAPFYRPIDRAGALYFLGLGEQISGEPGKAIAQYELAMKDVPEGQRLRGLLMLFIGECLDLQGNRSDAVVLYKKTLKEPPFWGVPRYARYLIKHPFRPTDDPLPPRSAELGDSASSEGADETPNL